MPEQPSRDAIEEALRHLPAAVYAAEGGVIREVGPGIERLLGQTPSAWIGRPLSELVPRSAEAGASTALHRLRHVSGALRLIRDTRTCLERVDGVPVVCGVLVDASEGSPDGHAPVRDPLTGLPTRAVLRDHLGRALVRAADAEETVVILHADLDEFRLVNESLGHATGDEVIRAIAQRVRAALPGSCLVARPAGDSLCVVLEDLASDFEAQAHVAVDQLVGAVREPLEAGGRSLTLGVTVGASVFPRDAGDADALLAHAEAALRQAKEDGRGGLAFYAGGTTGSLARLLLGAQLRQALDRSELVLHYQPIFALATGRVAAVEALLRWSSPDRGLVPPLEFIPVAEYTGLIEPIGRWVIDAVAAQAAMWKAGGVGVPVTFNVSLRQFRDPEFVPTLRRAMEREDIEPADLVVEITESTAMRDPASVEPVLAQLRDIGVPVAVDDFGAGHSSLGRLREMAVDILKLDRSLLPAELADERAAAIGGATLDLIAAFGVDAVAEGVETAEQHAFLRERGCALAQGFLLARPMPAAEVGVLLREQESA